MLYSSAFSLYVLVTLSSLIIYVTKVSNTETYKHYEHILVSYLCTQICQFIAECLLAIILM